MRNLDKTLAILKDELVPVITAGGEPVTLTDYPGIEGKNRAVFVRDPDGFWAEFMDHGVIINPGNRCKQHIKKELSHYPHIDIQRVTQYTLSFKRTFINGSDW